MCGIAGFFDADAATEASELGAVASMMADRLAHRGPDDAGVWTDERSGMAFAHRRLAIIDLTLEGRQPMTSASGRFVVTFNGEIYNFRALRGELEGHGIRFRSHSDTEVLLEAIEHWGLAGALERVNGMFAMGLWDRNEQTLHLIRDRLGEKPLYYGWVGRNFVFASELKAFRSFPGFQAEVDRGALALLLRHKYIPAPWSIYRGVRKLPPACVLSLRARDGVATPEPVPYWSARRAAERGAGEPLDLSIDDAVDQLDSLLRDSVRIRLESDVPLGAFLSGGIDSSTVVALMQAESRWPVRTFTVRLDDQAFDEADHGLAIARRLGTDHVELRVTPTEALDVIPRLPALYDEPFSDSSQIPTFLISQMARRHVTVALSGDGGDELFGGYNRHAWVDDIWRRVGWMPRPARRAGAAAIRKVPPARWDAFFTKTGRVLPKRLRQRVPGDKMHKLARALEARDAAGMYLSLVSHWPDPTSLVAGAIEPPTLVTDRTRWADLPDFTQQMMYLDAVGYLPDDILAKVDRASMGVGLEVRVPLLDHRVFEFAWRLPQSFKVRDGKGKWLLRRVLDRYVPSHLVDRPKAGFGIPLGDWLRGPLRDWAETLLGAGRLRAEGFLDAGPIRTAWAEHLSGKRSRQYELWDVLMFQAWLEETSSDVHGRAAAVRT